MIDKEYYKATLDYQDKIMKEKKMEELIEHLDDKMEYQQTSSNWFWFKNIHNVAQYLENDGRLDEITLTGEFQEEIDIIKEWINEYIVINSWSKNK